MDDGAIVELYLSRDERAIRETEAAYGARLRRLALGITQEEPSAEECENDTYLEAWNAIPPHEPRRYLYAFLARITRHLALNVLRAQSAKKRSARLCALTGELETCLPAPDDAACRLESSELRDALNGFLASLPAEKRAVFLRRYWFLESVEAIAARYAFSQSKVKSMLLRTRRELRTYLGQEGYTL